MAKGKKQCEAADHQFIKVSEVTQGDPPTYIYGAVVVCAFCGETRHVYESGEIVIKRSGVPQR